MHPVEVTRYLLTTKIKHSGERLARAGIELCAPVPSVIVSGPWPPLRARGPAPVDLGLVNLELITDFAF